MNVTSFQISGGDQHAGVKRQDIMDHEDVQRIRQMGFEGALPNNTFLKLFDKAEANRTFQSGFPIGVR